MLEYDKINLSKWIDVNETSKSSKKIFCNYNFLPRINFRLKPKISDGCHDSIQKTIIVNDAAIASLKENVYGIHFWYMSKDEAVNIMENCYLKKWRIVGSYHVTYTFWSKSTLCICQNVQADPFQNWCDIWNLSGCNGDGTHNHLVCKKALNNLAKLTELV